MPPSGPRLVVEVIAWWALLFLLYLVFISTLSPLELIVGAAAAGFATVGAAAVRRAAGAEAGPAGHLIVALWAWPGTLLAETGRLARLTLASLRGQPSTGRFAKVRLRSGVGSPWACALLSATPGSCVVAVDQKQGSAPVLTIHSLFESRSSLEAVLTEEGAT